jgi:hypothetical protein
MLGHLVQAEDETQLIVIYRIGSDGMPTLYTSLSFEKAQEWAWRNSASYSART